VLLINWFGMNETYVRKLRLYFVLGDKASFVKYFSFFVEFTRNYFFAHTKDWSP